MHLFKCSFSLIFNTIICITHMQLVGAVMSEKFEPEIHTVERVNFLTNKTVKILTGQSKPPVQQLQPPGPPMAIQNYYPPQNQYPNQNPNQYPQQYPHYPQSPDLTGQGSGPKPSFQQPQPPQRPQESGVPEIYKQIVGAIETLVGRMDKLDSRLKTLENIVLHLTNKKEEPNQGNCPEKFVKIDGIRGKCFHVSTLNKNSNNNAVINSGFELFDWKNAHAECNKMGGRLTEMVNYDDYVRISKFLIKYTDPKNNAQTSTDFWVGGINPGLIWIWSESGQKVGMDLRFWNENDNSSNAPGCLKLSFSHRLDAFFFKGAPCSHTQNIICEVMDNSVSRALAQFEQDLIDDDSDEKTLMKGKEETS